MTLDADEIEIINRAWVAVQLKALPAVIDEQPAPDIWDVLGVLRDEVERTNEMIKDRNK